MRPYDPKQPLVSIHIPRCGGTSLRRVLQGWFGERMHIHYFQQNDAPPPRLQLGAGDCIHGHFNRQRGIGVPDYYPDATQCIAFLRDPLEAAISNYFFWKRKARPRQIALGRLVPGGPGDYRDIEDFFRDRPLSVIPDFLPEPIGSGSIDSLLSRRFLYIGFLEEYPRSLAALAALLGKPPAAIGRENNAERDAERLSEASRERFRESNLEAYAVCEAARRLFPAGDAERAG